MTIPLPDLVLYARPGCGLCDEARAVIGALLADRDANGQATPTLREVDITTDPALERRWFDRIPVVELGERRVELVTGVAKLRRLLADALD
ncbi:MAG TPA: glutaredoxin family protein [Candidatus Limnocylindrales bacterium]|nr:glutaredoxin family protein [Candidatus Limnocylindrales bacterium]